MNNKALNIEKDFMQAKAYAYIEEYKKVFSITAGILVKVSLSKKFADDCYAEVTNNDYKGREFFTFTISMYRHYKNDAELRNSIFHELAHIWQHLSGFEMAHDDSFWQWEKTAKAHGVTIRYIADNYEEYKK